MSIISSLLKFSLWQKIKFEIFFINKFKWIISFWFVSRKENYVVVLRHIPQKLCITLKHKTFHIQKENTQVWYENRYKNTMHIDFASIKQIPLCGEKKCEMYIEKVCMCTLFKILSCMQIPEIKCILIHMKHNDSFSSMCKYVNVYALYNLLDTSISIFAKFLPKFLTYLCTSSLIASSPPLFHPPYILKSYCIKMNTGEILKYFSCTSWCKYVCTSV